MNEYYFGENLYDLSILNETEDATGSEVASAIDGADSSTETSTDSTAEPAESTELTDSSTAGEVKVDEGIKKIINLKDINLFSKRLLALSCLSTDGWNKAKDKGDFEKDDIEKVNKLLDNYTKGVSAAKAAEKQKAKEEEQKKKEEEVHQAILTNLKNGTTTIVTNLEDVKKEYLTNKK